MFVRLVRSYLRLSGVRTLAAQIQLAPATYILAEVPGFLPSNRQNGSKPQGLDRRRGAVRVWDMKAKLFVMFVALLMVGCK